MVFSELTFLCLFFPLTAASYYVIPNRVYRNCLLLMFSLLFYAWGEPRYIVLMLAVAVTAYAGGLVIHRFRKQRKLCKAAFLLTLGLIVLNLLVFKYTNFFADNLGLLVGRPSALPQIALPIGISFYTFQILSYVIDLYLGNIGLQKNFFYLLLYLSFFPQLIAGPIVRYSTVEYEIQNRSESWAEVVAGIRRFTVGLAKKVILANHVAPIAEMVYAGDPAQYGTVLYWVAALAYTMQIYFDFSAYSDMAIGMGRMFGFHFLENFQYPYIAASVTDFWRRWHISLSTWFRDYIYIPLGGNRVSVPRNIFNLSVVWALTGFWHGASWNFVLWGVYYGLLLILEKFVLRSVLEKLPRLLGWLYQFFIVNVGWVIFNLTDFPKLGTALRTMFLFTPTQWGKVLSADTSILLGLIYLPLAFVAAFPVLKWAERQLGDSLWADLVKNGLCLLLLVVCIVYIVSSSYNPFIYFRF